jgi:hypothetical protein
LHVTKASAQKAKIGFQQVTIFLSGMERNSLSSRYAYQNGLIHFQRSLSQKYPSYNLETILKPLAENKISPYELLDNFVSYLQTLNLTPSSIKLYVASIRSYFAYNDVDVIPSKFKQKVKMPKSYREDEEPLDVNDIRKIKSCWRYPPIWKNKNNLEGFYATVLAGCFCK